MVEANQERRTCARPSATIRRVVEIQPEQSPVVGWSVREVDWSGKERYVQGDRWGEADVVGIERRAA